MIARHARQPDSSRTQQWPARSGQIANYVSFWLNGELLAIPVDSVQEVLIPQPIASTPRARPEVAGLLNLRGQIVTAVNLRKRLNLPDLDEGKQSMNVVVRHGGEAFSLLVDDVGDIIDVAGLSMVPVPRTLDAHWKAVTVGVFNLPERLCIVLDVGALLTLC